MVQISASLAKHCMPLLLSAIILIAITPNFKLVNGKCINLKNQYVYRNYSNAELASTQKIYQCCALEDNATLYIINSTKQLSLMADTKYSNTVDYNPFGYAADKYIIKRNHCFPRTKIGFTIDKLDAVFSLEDIVSSKSPKNVDQAKPNAYFKSNFDGWSRTFTGQANVTTFIKSRYSYELRDVKISLIRTIVRQFEGNPGATQYEENALVWFPDEDPSDDTGPQCVWQFSTNFEKNYKPPTKCSDMGRLFYPILVLVILMLFAAIV